MCAARASGSAGTRRPAKPASLIAPQLQRRCANRTDPERIAVIAKLRTSADDGCRDRRDARHAALDRLRDLDPDRDGPPRPARSRAGGPLRAGTARRARARRRQEARPDRRRRRPACPRAAANTTTRSSPTPPASRGAPSGTSTSTSLSTITAASPTPKCSQTRKRLPPSASSAAPSRFYRRYGIRVEAVISDNGGAYISIAHAIACRRLRIQHLRIRPYRPQTNGKAERFIRTMLNGWAYGAIYRSSRERTAALDGWLWHYNHRRRHSALGHQPPITRTNLLGSYI